jgi:hypothetical protein
MVSLVQFFLLQIIAVFAMQVAKTAYWLGHHIKRVGKGGDGGHTL